MKDMKTKAKETSQQRYDFFKIMAALYALKATGKASKIDMNKKSE